MIIVRSWDDLLDTGVGLILERLPKDQLHFTDDLVLQIGVRGNTWDGAIDYRGAHFVLELQRAVNRLYSELHGEIISPRELGKIVTVKVKIVEGSSWFQINFGDALKSMVGRMSGGQIILTVGLCLLAASGTYTASKIIDYKKEVAIHARQMQKDESVNAAQNQMLEKSIEKLTGTIDKALEVIQKNDLEAPTRKLVHNLDPDDTITLPDNSELSSDDAKKRYPRKPKSKRLSDIFDATYTIKNIDLSEAPPVFTLLYGDLEFRASAELAHQDIERLVRDLESTLKSGSNLTVPLHVFILYNKRQIISAAIQGIGDPRAATNDIETLAQR